MRRVSRVVTVACVAAAMLAAPVAVASAAPVTTPSPAGPSPTPAATHRTAPTKPTDVPVAATSTLPAAHNGTVRVSVSGDPDTVRTKVAALGGHVVVSADGQNTVEVPETKLSALGDAAGVGDVRAPTPAYVTDSEGVAESGASTWQAAGDGGSHVAIAIVDAGFGNLSAEQLLGHLPATGHGVTLINEGCSDGGTAASAQHGTAVAEVVHQMAPAAGLYLYCVTDSTGFSAAANSIIAKGIKIASSSLGFPGDARGDGTGAAGSASVAVHRARAAGVLWIQSAGNNAAEHWAGTLVDRDHDGLVDLGCSGASCPEADSMFMVPGDASASIVFKWDQWPASDSPDITLVAVGYKCDASYTTCSVVGSASARQTKRSEPTLGIDVSNRDNTYVRWDVGIEVGKSRPSVGYDLSYWGDVSDPSYLAALHPSEAAAGSITEPASSPYAMAVGATCANSAVGCSEHHVEYFSSRGPSIDGRVKPDILGWDCVSSYLSEFDDGFCGTSAAAPHVAGAAALVKSADQHLDATQLETVLEQRAHSGAPLLPPTNTSGVGVVTLGSHSGVLAPAGSGYRAITPVRLLNTRTSLGGHHGAVGPGRTVTVHVPDLPADVTAVALEVTGSRASAKTSLAAYQGGTGPPGVTDLTVNSKDPTVTSFVVAAVDPHSDTVTIRNSSGSVQVAATAVGYFGTARSGGYTPVKVRTLLDTRTKVGGHHAKLRSGSAVSVKTGLPARAAAAVISLTATGVSGLGSLGVAASCSHSATSLYADHYGRTALAIVQLTSAERFCLTHSGDSSDARIQLLGYFGSTGSRFHPVLSPSRIVNTRTGNGLRAIAPIGSRQRAGFFGAGFNGVPAAAKALLVGLENVNSTASSGGLSVYPGSSLPSPYATTLYFTRSRVVNDAAIVGVSSKRFGVYNSAGSSNAVVDLYGYFA